MWTQLLYAMHDIKQKKSYYIAFLVQMTVVILLLNNCINIFKNRENAFASLDNVYKGQDAYYVSLNNYEEDIYMNSYEEELMQEIYRFIENNENLIYFSQTEKYLEIPDIPLNSLYELIEMDNEKIKMYKTLFVNANFIEIFNLDMLDAAIFNLEEWQQYDNTQAAVILGNGYKDLYKTGDFFTDAKGKKYIIKGILKAGQSFVDISFGEGTISLDDIILISSHPTAAEQIPKEGNIDFETYFENMTLLPVNSKVLADLQDICNKSKLYAYNFKSVAGVADYMKLETDRSISIFSFIIVMVIIFALLMIVIQTLDFIKKKKKEFAIHIFSGATKADVILRLVLQILIIVIAAGMAAAFFTKDFLSTAGISLLILCVCLLTSIPGIVVLFKLQISEILRRKE